MFDREAVAGAEYRSYIVKGSDIVEHHRDRQFSLFTVVLDIRSVEIPDSFFLHRLLSVNNIETGIPAQNFGNDNTFGSLVILENGSHDTRERKGRSIESVAETYLLVRVAETALKTIGLVCFEIADR